MSDLENQPLDIFSLLFGDFEAQVAALRKKADELLAKKPKYDTQRPELQTPEHVERAGELCADLLKSVKAISEVANLCHKPISDIDEQYRVKVRAILQPLEDFEGEMRARIKRYQEREFARKKAEAQTSGKAETGAPAAIVSDRGTRVEARTYWDYELVDIQQVPREWLIVNDAAVRAAITKKNGVRQIRGLRIFEAVKGPVIKPAK